MAARSPLGSSSPRRPPGGRLTPSDPPQLVLGELERRGDGVEDVRLLGGVRAEQVAHHDVLHVLEVGALPGRVQLQSARGDSGQGQGRTSAGVGGQESGAQVTGRNAKRGTGVQRRRCVKYDVVDAKHAQYRIHLLNNGTSFSHLLHHSLMGNGL